MRDFRKRSLFSRRCSFEPLEQRALLNASVAFPPLLADTATVSGGGAQNMGNDTALDSTSSAPVRVWDGGGNNNSWSNPANWQGDVAPAAGDQLVFTGGTRPATVNDFPAGTPFDEITFTSSGFTLSGNRVTLNPLGGMAIDDAGSQDTLALPITLGTDGTFEVTGGGALNLASTASIDTGGYALTVDCAAGSSGSQWAGAVVGSGGLTKTGAGTLTLTGASTYSGATAIENGTLVLAGGDNRLPSGTTVTLGDAANQTSGILQLGNAATASNQTLAALTNDMDYQYDATGNRVVGGGSQVATLTLNVAAGADYEFDGILGGGGSDQNNVALTMTGPGTEELGGVNSYGGGTTLRAGVLQVWNGAALGSGAVTSAGGALRNLASTSYYVDPAGLGGTPSDTNPGTIHSPLATLAEAYRLCKPGDTIILRGGTYHLADLGYGNSTSGAPGAPLTIEAAPGEHPIIDLAEWETWQPEGNGCWYTNLPATSYMLSSPEVEIRNGAAATEIDGDSVNGGPPAAFTQPDSAYYQNGQLAFDLTWYDAANHRLWFRSNEIEPITNPDTQCGVVAPNGSQAFEFYDASWLVIKGIQIQNGYIGIHIADGADHITVEDCRITNMWAQGILLYNSSYDEVSNNYVDAVGGQLSDRGREWLYHDLYIAGEGELIHDNFFGRAFSGASAQILDSDPAAPTVFTNNVCYGGWAFGVVTDATGDIITGNVIISPQTIWRGSPPASSFTDATHFGFDVLQSGAASDMILSGNYIEGYYRGAGYESFGSSFTGQTVPGWVLASNTIVSGRSDIAFDRLPAEMGSNQWGGCLTFNVPGQLNLNYADFLAWEQTNGYGSLSAAMTTALIDPTAFDAQLDAGPTLAQAMAIFRTYAAATVDGFADCPAVVPSSTLGGTTTPDVNGASPQAGNDAYNLDVGTTLVVDAAHGVLVNDRAPAQQTLTAVLVANPTHGQLTLKADGSFSYTPYASVSGTDKFTYMASDGHGGAALATVILYIPLSPSPNLSLGIAHAGNFTQGDVGDTYTIVVNNVGNFATSGTVSLTDSLPAGLTATAFSGDGWTVDLATLTATRSDPLAPSASYPPLTLTVNVAYGAPASLTDTATVSGGGEQNTLDDTALDPTSITQVRVWDGGGNNNSWSNPANWQGDVAPAAGDQLVFAGGTRPATVNDLPAGTPFDEITFTRSGFTLSGNRVTLNPRDGIAIDDAGSQDTLSLPITLGTDGTFEVTGAGALNVAPTASIDTSGYTLTVDCAAGSSGSQWAGVVVGSGGLTKTGPGTLTLTGASTYSGATAIEDGTLAVAGGDDRLPSGTTVILGDEQGDSGILQLGNAATASNQSLAGLFVTGDGSSNRVVGGGTAIVTLALTVDSSDNWDQYDGLLGGPGANQNNFALEMDGSGVVLLTGDNTFAGGTYLNNGAVATWGSNTAFGTGTIYLDGGALGGQATLSNPLVAVDSTDSSIVPLGTLTLAGDISGPGMIYCSNYPYDNISDDVLQLAGDNSGFTGTFDQSEDSDSGTIVTQFVAPGAASSQAAWVIESGVLANHIDPQVSAAPMIALGALSGGGTLSNLVADSTVTYQIGSDGNNPATEFDGTIEDGCGIVALTKVGAGGFTLTGANTYTGVTTIESGTLQIDNATATTNVLTNAGGVNNTGGSLVLDYSTSGTSVASTVQSRLQTAYNNGANRFQTGVIHNTSATSSIGLGWADNPATHQVTIMPALYGDTNLDGTVGLADLNTVLTNYGKSGMNWSQGDFSYDGVVGLADLNKLLTYYGQTLPSGTPAAESFSADAALKAAVVPTAPAAASRASAISVAPVTTVDAPAPSTNNGTNDVLAIASPAVAASGQVAVPAVSSGTASSGTASSGTGATVSAIASRSVATSPPAAGVSELPPSAPRPPLAQVPFGPSPVPAVASPTITSPTTPPSTPRTLDDFEPAVPEATARRAGAGFSVAAVQKLTPVLLDVSDLPGPLAGEAAGNCIYLDTNKEGFTSLPNRQPRPTVDPRVVDRTDLLTVAAHEWGPMAGCNDLDALTDDVMNGVLAGGIRRRNVSHLDAALASL